MAVVGTAAEVWREKAGKDRENNMLETALTARKDHFNLIRVD